MSQNTEHKIMYLFKEDREKAFRLFFDTYYIMLCDYVLLILDDFEDVEDVVQSFFIKFWEKRLDETITDSLKSFSLRCVRNAAIKRRVDSDLTLSLTEGEYLIYESEETLLEEKQQLENKLKDALGKLSVKEYDALKSVIIDEKTYAEAAKELNISINTLKTYLKRAFKKLKKSDLLILLVFLSPISRFYDSL